MTNYHPSGIEFFDMDSDRRMMLVDNNEPRRELRGWLLYWNEGYKNWVTLRKATDADLVHFQPN